MWSFWKSCSSRFLGNITQVGGNIIGNYYESTFGALVSDSSYCLCFLFWVTDRGSLYIFHWDGYKEIYLQNNKTISKHLFKKCACSFCAENSTKLSVNLLLIFAKHYWIFSFSCADLGWKSDESFRETYGQENNCSVIKYSEMTFESLK